MEQNKLTYYQIFELIKNGREEEIPRGYNIVWFDNIKPCKCFEEEVPFTNITIIRNGCNIPLPQKAFVKGEMVIAEIEYRLKEKVADYGNIYFDTRFVLTDLGFEFAATEEYLKWEENYLTSINKNRIEKAKKDLTFDIEIRFGHRKLDVFNILLTQTRNVVLASTISDWARIDLGYEEYNSIIKK